MDKLWERMTLVQNWLATYGLVYLLRFLGAIVLFLVGRWAAAALARVTGATMRRSHVDETLVRFTMHGVNLLVLVAVVLACLDLVGVQTTSIVALIGAAGLAIGLAMQGSLANFAAGMLIIFFRPFRVGDFISAADTSGTVEEISLFTTHLCTPDNRAVIVPNARITNGNIINFTARDTRRIELKVCVGYDADVEVARQVIMSVVTSDPRVLTEPKPVVGLMNLGETSVELAVWMWVKLKDELAVKFAVNEELKRELENAGCAIQYQTRVVRLVPIAEKSA